MIQQDIQLIDHLIVLVKNRDISASYFQSHVIDSFEFRFLLTLEIVRFELKIDGALSDKTAMAIGGLFPFGAFEFYYRDYPSIYEVASQLFVKLIGYNTKLANDEFSTHLGYKDAKWVSYFNHSIKAILAKFVR